MDKTHAGNWLMTSAGAKVDLARRMRCALNAKGCRLYAADCSPLSAAFSFVDGHFLLPDLDDEGFVTQLIDACIKRAITVLLPTRDADLLFFARHRVLLEAAGIQPLVSPLESIEICRDKIRFHAHCLQYGLPVLPRLHMPCAGDFPCFVRPRVGAASAGAGHVQTLACMQAMYGEPPWENLLIQPCSNDQEFSIDSLFGPDGKVVQWIARQRIRVRAGESVVSRTVKLPAFEPVINALANAMRLFGPITLQAFFSPENGLNLIEVNPRFGGASALGSEAGLDVHERLVAFIQGDLETFYRPRPLRYDVTLLRFSQDIFI
jgi:carbamoyl-phosphate synthase large subunit